jgi:HSP20 family protein
MARDNFQGWMWSEAVAVLSRAERLHRQFFRPLPATQEVAWEPPVDVLELEDMVLIIVALPGIDPDHVETVIEDGSLRVSGRREHPPELRTAVIHRLELPQGRFERHVPLPPGRYAAVIRSASHGCLLVSLHKTA